MTDPDDALERVRRDPELRVLLRTARAWGTSPTRLLGVEPATRVVRDDAGRVARLEREPEWSPEWRALAVALAVFEADTCSGCGLQLSDTTQPDRDGLYVAELPVRCHSCSAIGEAAQAHADGGGRQGQALRWPIVYHPPVTAAELEHLLDDVSAGEPGV